jgi:hypothetical protein
MRSILLGTERRRQVPVRPPSILFANVDLDALDHFVKERLQVRLLARDVDNLGKRLLVRCAARR